MPESRNHPRVENRLVNILFAGWESNTYRLQQQGWQISVNEDPSSRFIQIALKHPQLSMYGLTEKVDYRRMEDIEAMQRHSGMCLQVIRMETNMMIDQPIMMLQEVVAPGMRGFVPVDARPSVTMKEQTHIDDFRIFRPMAEHKQIIVPEQNVGELMAKIHELQTPEQDRIREDKRKRMARELYKCNQDASNYNISTNIVAQISTFA
jgi:hypothetical protein